MEASILLSTHCVPGLCPRIVQLLHLIPKEVGGDKACHIVCIHLAQRLAHLLAVCVSVLCEGKGWPGVTPVAPVPLERPTAIWHSKREGRQGR